MRLKQYLRKRLNGRPLLLMTHAVVGYPSLDDNWRMLEGMHNAGVDLVELQMPFSEPIADGPAFIRANQEALARGIHRDDYFEFMRRARSTFDIAMLFMGYYNSVYRMGAEDFCRRLRDAGGDGFIIADLPPEEAHDLTRCASEYGLDGVHMMTPVNSEPRLREIARDASGFIYCVARTGVTGRGTRIGAETRSYIERCRRVTDLPVALGFGIQGPDQLRDLHGVADIAIVGTACLEAWEHGGAVGYGEFLKSLVEATTPQKVKASPDYS